MKVSNLVAALATVASFSLTEAASKKSKRTFGILKFGGGKELTRCRIDPIVNPGGVAGHLHSIFGGDAFSASMPGDTASSAGCTTARVKKDKSNYWVPSLYFKSPKDGKVYPVELFYAQVYYFFEPTNDDIKAFPKGFRMRSGDPSLRHPPSPAKNNLDSKQGTITPAMWTCPRDSADKDRIPLYPANSDGTKGCGVGNPNNGGEGWGFPDKECNGYASPLRADIHFPSCVNPNADVENWKENSAFPSDNGQFGQDCPKGWIHVPHIFVEAYWDTLKFQGQWEPEKGTQPWVLSNGDTTGYSLHADFINGWDSDILQGLIDTCDAGHAGLQDCLPASEQTTEEEMKNCKVTCPLDESKVDVLGSPMPNNALLGNNPFSGYQISAYVAPGGSGSSPVKSSAPVVKPATAAPKPSTTLKVVTIQSQPQAQVTTPAPVVVVPQSYVEQPKVVVVTYKEIRTKKVIKTVIVSEPAATEYVPAPKTTCTRRRKHNRHGAVRRHGSY